MPTAFSRVLGHRPGPFPSWSRRAAPTPSLTRRSSIVHGYLLAGQAPPDSLPVGPPPSGDPAADPTVEATSNRRVYGGADFGYPSGGRVEYALRGSVLDGFGLRVVLIWGWPLVSGVQPYIDLRLASRWQIEGGLGFGAGGGQGSIWLGSALQYDTPGVFQANFGAPAGNLWGSARVVPDVTFGWLW